MAIQIQSGSGGAIADMNVVPLIDVLLVLLIIFMVITPTMPQGLEALVPQPSPNQPVNQDIIAKTIVVQVETGGKLKINQEETTWEVLGPRLEEIFKQRAEKIAFVKGHEDVQFHEVARAIDIMRGSGVDKVGLITAKLEAGQ